LSVGERIAEERKRLGLSQEAFAKQIGISFSSQRRYEANDRVPNIRYVAALENAGVDVAYVMTGARTPTETLSFYSALDRQAAELLVLFSLQLDIGGFSDAVAAVKAKEGTPEFLSRVLDALIENSPPLLARLNNAQKKK